MGAQRTGYLTWLSARNPTHYHFINYWIHLHWTYQSDLTNVRWPKGLLTVNARLLIPYLTNAHQVVAGRFKSKIAGTGSDLLMGHL